MPAKLYSSLYLEKHPVRNQNAITGFINDVVQQKKSIDSKMGQKTALVLAIEYLFPAECVERLLELGANPNEMQGKQNKQTPLHFVVELFNKHEFYRSNEQADLPVKYMTQLFKKGASIEIDDDGGSTVLHTAMLLGGHPEYLTAILDNVSKEIVQAVLGFRDQYGETPMHKTSILYKELLYRMIEEGRPHLDKPNFFGKTVLQSLRETYKKDADVSSFLKDLSRDCPDERVYLEKPSISYNSSDNMPDYALEDYRHNLIAQNVFETFLNARSATSGVYRQISNIIQRLQRVFGQFNNPIFNCILDSHDQKHAKDVILTAMTKSANDALSQAMNYENTDVNLVAVLIQYLKADPKPYQDYFLNHISRFKAISARQVITLIDVIKVDLNKTNEVGNTLLMLVALRGDLVAFMAVLEACSQECLVVVNQTQQTALYYAYKRGPEFFTLLACRMFEIDEPNDVLANDVKSVLVNIVKQLKLHPDCQDKNVVNALIKSLNQKSFVCAVTKSTAPKLVLEFFLALLSAKFCRSSQAENRFLAVSELYLQLMKHPEDKERCDKALTEMTCLDKSQNPDFWRISDTREFVTRLIQGKIVSCEFSEKLHGSLPEGETLMEFTNPAFKL